MLIALDVVMLLIVLPLRGHFNYFLAAYITTNLSPILFVHSCSFWNLFLIGWYPY